MSKIPTPAHQQVATILQLALSASMELINQSPNNSGPLRSTFLQFYASATFQLIVGIPSHLSPNQPAEHQLKAELQDIRSNIQTLSKTVAGLQPKATGPQLPLPPSQKPSTTGKPAVQGKGHGQPSSPTFASKAAAKARPSLVLDLGAPKSQQTDVSIIIAKLNDKLHLNEYDHIKLSAATWTAKGNLVITAHQSVNQVQLTSTAPAILSFYTADFGALHSDTDTLPTFKPEPTLNGQKSS